MTCRVKEVIFEKFNMSLTLCYVTKIVIEISRKNVGTKTKESEEKL